MSMLKGFQFIAAPRAASQLSVEEVRRNKLIKHLLEQRAIAIAEAAGETHSAKRSRWVKNESGVKERVEVEKRLKRWWVEQADGQVVLTVRWGSRAIEWERGKAAINVGDRGKLTAIFDKLIAAVQAGEIDQHIELLNKARTTPKKKAA